MTRLLLALLLLPSLCWAQPAQVFHEDRFSGAWYSPQAKQGIQHGDSTFKGQALSLRVGPRWVGGNHPTAFIAVSFIGRPVSIPSGLAAQLVDFYQANSYGALLLQIDSFTVHIPEPPSCNYVSIAALADQQVRAAQGSAVLSKYLHKAYFFPQVSSCGFSGVSTIGGSPSQAWINGNFILRVVAHEFGHSLGNTHSHSLACGLLVVGVIGVDCASVEYGDEFDVMGSGESHLNAAVKTQMGWLHPQTGSGTFTLTSFLTSPSALQVPRGSDSFWLEYRPEGVILHLTPGPFMLKMQTWADPSLGPAWTDPQSGLKFEVNRMDPGSVTVTVGGSSNPDPVGVDISRTFTRLKTTDPPALVQAGGYTCARLMGGNSALQIKQGSRTLKSIVYLRPAFKVPFTLRCQVSDGLVSLSLDGHVLVVAQR